MHFDRPFPTTNPGNSTSEPNKVGGLRIKEIKTEAKTRKFNYASGTMMRQPVLYYIGRRNGMPEHIGDVIVQVSESQTPLSTFNRGNFVGYDWVEEYVEDDLGNISKTRYTFHNDAETELFDDSFPDSPYYLNYTNGLPRSIERYKIKSQSSPELVEMEEFFYTSTNSSLIKAFKDRGQKRHDSDLLPYHYQIEWPLETQHVKTIMTDSGEDIIKEVNYAYNSRDLVQSTSYELNNSPVIEKFKYSFEYSDAISVAMVNKNMVGMPIETITLRGNKVVDGTKTQYEEVSGKYLPKTILKTEINSTNVTESNYSSYYQPFLYFYKYDSKCNILELSKPNGPHTFYVWGYNQEYPIAKIENFNSQVNMTPGIQSLIDNAVVASANDNDHCTDNGSCAEKNLRTALNALRNALPGALVTTYTYDPLIGMTSATDVNNLTTYYIYDLFGRLESVRDSSGNIVRTNTYHYKN